MEYHDAANIFPLDEGTIFELAKDISKNGLLKPIEVLGGKILDGRRRFLACEKAGIDPVFVEVATDDPVAYSWSLNGPRRHCTPAQLAMVGARMRDIYDEDAKRRMHEGQKSGGRGNKKNSPAQVPESLVGDTRDIVGKIVGVSGKLIDRATRVRRHGIPDLEKAVDEGRMGLDTAAILATEPEEEQRKELDNPKRNRKYTPAEGGGNGRVEPKQVQPEEEPNGERRGKGVILANEAINCLKRIPKNDALRKRGFQIVTDWIKANRRD